MMKFQRSMIFYFLFLCSARNIAYSQVEASYKNIPVSLTGYLSHVIKGNLGYIAAQLNVSIAEAELKASRVLPDPEVTIMYSNNEDRRLQMGQSLETGLTYPINLGNKRKAGIGLARSEYELSGLMLDTYLQNLRAEAALYYFTGLKNRSIYQLQVDIYKQLTQLARADSIRLLKGEATGLDALQSSLEARSQLTEVDQSLADMQNAFVNMMYVRGKKLSDTLDIPTDSFPYRKRYYDMNMLMDHAVENRAELLAAIKNKEVSENYLNLIKANRAIEMSLEAGYSYNSVVKNEIAPAPDFNGLSAGIAVPLKFSGLNKGPVQSANLAIRKSEMIYEETELQIRSEVVQAFNDFVAQDKKVEHYNSGLIEDAYKILQGRIYSYQHGESGLIDVLNAQRTYIELQLSYINALFEYTSSLIKLERSADIWDLTAN